MFKNVHLRALILASMFFFPIHAKTNNSSQENIYLFSRARCPYCIKVMNYLRAHNKTIKTKDISEDPAALQELVSKGGKRQVPCLFHDGQYLYESNEIIHWLGDHLDLLPNAK